MRRILNPKFIILNFFTLLMLNSCKEEVTIPIDQQVEEIYAKLTPEERIAQLCGIYMTQFFDENDKLDTAKCRQLIPNGVGHFSQFALNTQRTPDQLRDMVAQMQEWLMENTPSGIPALCHEEVLSGVNGYDATIYPQQIGLACSFNTELAEQKTYETATLLRKMGGFLALSPMVDVVRTPSFNRLEESYGEDGYLSAAMGVAFVQGLQHGDLHDGIAACTKHFLGYGGGGDADAKELMEEILLPHEAIIRLADSKALMPGYHNFNGEKCVGNDSLLQGILRGYLHYDGIVVSDYGAIEQIDDNLSDAERAAKALNAGNDVDFPEGNSYKHLPEAVKQGLTTDKAIEKAVKRILRLKAELGLFDKKVPLYSKNHITADTPDERETAYLLATQSVVMLKNDTITDSIEDGVKVPVLPLIKNIEMQSYRSDIREKKVFLTGPNANSMWAMCGDYSYPAMRYFWKKSIEDGMHPHVVGLKEGMQENMPEGIKLSYARGCDWTEEVETIVESSGDPRVAYLVDIQNRMINSGEKADWDKAIEMAKQSDVIVAAMGENAILCGENRDRKHMRLPGRQEEYVEALIATGKPVVLIVFGGRAQILTKIAGKCAAIIQAWYPGEEGGNALADILYGRVSPSGKLSVSYPKVEIKTPICYNYSETKDYRIEWPFGYGLSYTQFEYSGLKVTPSASTNAKEVKLSFTIKNSGMVEGDEIAQIYLSPENGKTRTHRAIQLQGFARVSLRPNESKRISVTMPMDQFGYYANGEWNIAPGNFIVKVGASSTDIRLKDTVELTGETITKPLRDEYFSVATQQNN